MVVHEQSFATAGALFAEAGEVNLAGVLDWKRVDVRLWRRTVVGCRNHDVVDVEQELASGSRRHLAEKLGLCQSAVGEQHVGRRILEQNRSTQPALHLIDVRADEGKRALRIRQRQQIVEEAAAVCRPSEMLGYQPWLVA